MASRSFKVTYALTPNQAADGSFTLPDPYTLIVGNTLSMLCTVDGNMVQDVGSMSFQSGEQVALNVGLQLIQPDNSRQLSRQSQQIDEVLDGLVDFTQSQPPSLRTQITGLLFGGHALTLEGAITIPAAAATVGSSTGTGTGTGAAVVPTTASAVAPAIAPSIATSPVSASAPSPTTVAATSVTSSPATGSTTSVPTSTTTSVATAAPTSVVPVATSVGNTPPLAVGTDPNSGPVASADYKIQHPVTLQRTTRALTADVALWLLIKMNADYLGWNNYEQQLALLFGPGGTATNPPTQPGSEGYDTWNSAQHLSRRRFLPFTDNDAYRALKVATEAFVVTWGGVVPGSQDVGSVATLLAEDPYAISLASERLGIDVSPTQLLDAMSSQYFGSSLPPTLPYLTRVVDGLRGTDAMTLAQNAQQQVAVTTSATSPPTVPAPTNSCGETCLWLAHLNQNFSAKLTRPPLIELIWSYWMEELQLVQTMNAISRRFQNVSSGPRDPLAQIELDPLRPLNNMIWGWVQDEQHRLPIERRAAEYQHEYGFRIFGRAVPSTHVADVRSKFLAAFHTLLNLCVPFFRQADDTTVVPDGFPLLNALREVHLVLSEGAHNQFRDLPSTSRIEMLMQQWILARPEFREFLPRRAMIAYPESWMHSVESMRKLQGWGDTNTYQFWQLATTGEQIVSSIRWGNWNSVNDPNNAANWAVFFRPEIQTYIHSYRAVTGVDVSAEPVDVQVPGMHLLRRMHESRIKAA